MAPGKKIYLTDQDLSRLQQLADEQGDTRESEALQDELGQAIIVPQELMPPDVVTMNSRVRFKDIGSGKSFEVTLCYPKNADLQRGRLSILDAAGIALLGLSQGDRLEWQLPDGTTTTLEIQSILYQPEQSGDWDL